MGDEQDSLPGIPEREEPNDRADDERSTPPRLKGIDRRQLLFRTVDVEQLIPKEHPARAIWEFVGRLDLSGFTEPIRSVVGRAGRPAYDPQLLVSLWFYSYSQSVSSARAIERLCEHHPAYQWLTGMESISAHTLSDFRVAHGDALNDLFVQAVGLLSAEGLVSLERVMQDGTKVQANAASSGFRGKERMEAFLEQARDALEALEAETEEESSRKMQAARQRAARERQQRIESALKEFGKLEAAKSDVKRVSLSDPDARIMKQASGGSGPSYNVQVSTDADNGIVVDIEATQAGNDYHQLKPAMERIKHNLQRSPGQLVVDGGYISNDNIVETAKSGMELIGPDLSDTAESKRRKAYQQHGVSPEYHLSKFDYDEATNAYVCPQGKRLPYEGKTKRNHTMRYRYRASEKDCQACPAKNLCCPRTRRGRSVERVDSPEITAFRQMMQTEQAKAIYRTRAQVAEFPNLWIKAKFGLRQFSVRGLAKVRIESLWVAFTYNILQWIRLRWRPRIAPELAPT